ncbi:MAG: cation:proton antiporter [Nanoarchaeota archaeon]
MIEFASGVVFQMTLLLFVALAGYLIALRINQSAVVGIILVGIIVGPSLLGLITYTDFVANIAELGAVVLLFVVGLEFKLQDIAKGKYFVIGACGVIIPWLGGYGIAKLFGFSVGNAFIVAAALTATSIAITANVLKEMGKLQSETAKAIIATAVIDDILALVVLTISMNAISGTLSFWPIGLIIVKAILFLAIGVVIGYIFVARLIVKLDRSKIATKYPEFVFILSLMFAFGYALIAEFIGLSAIVGAFLAGVCLEGITLKHSKSYREGSEYLYIVFASIFFVSLGVLTNVKAINVFIVIFLIALIIVAIITKVIGCAIPSLLFGMKKKDALIIGIGMVPRGEVAMIVALLALNKNIIGQDIYVSLVLMALITTIITPFALRKWFFRQEKRANIWTR